MENHHAHYYSGNCLHIYPYVLDLDPRSTYFSHPLLDRPRTLLAQLGMCAMVKGFSIGIHMPLQRYNHIKKRCGPKVFTNCCQLFALQCAVDHPMVVSYQSVSVRLGFTTAGELLVYQGAMYQWEFQDPKMEVLYHIVGHILWGYSLT